MALHYSSTKYLLRAFVPPLPLRDKNEQHYFLAIRNTDSMMGSAASGLPMLPLSLPLFYRQESWPIDFLTG